jgi:hypothetical protein
MRESCLKDPESFQKQHFVDRRMILLSWQVQVQELIGGVVEVDGCHVLGLAIQRYQELMRCQLP